MNPPGAVGTPQGWILCRSRALVLLFPTFSQVSIHGLVFIPLSFPVSVSRRLWQDPWTAQQVDDASSPRAVPL